MLETMTVSPLETNHRLRNEMHAVPSLPRQGYRSTDHVPLHFTTTTAREKPRKRGFLVIGEVLAVTAGGIGMAAAAVLAARDQMGASP